MVRITEKIYIYFKYNIQHIAFFGDSHDILAFYSNCFLNLLISNTCSPWMKKFAKGKFAVDYHFFEISPSIFADPSKKQIGTKLTSLNSLGPLWTELLPRT